MAVSSCSSFSKRTTSEDEPAHNPAQIDWTKEFTPPAKARSNTDESLQSDDQKQPKPHFKSLSPLDTERVNLSFVKENAAQVLQLLAHTAGLNLVLADAVGDKSITAEYLDMPVREVLNSVCKILNVAWKDENNTIYIEQTTDKIFNIDFLGIVRKSNFSVGGDVLGGGQSGSTGGTQGGSGSPLNGAFKIEGEVSDSISDINKNIEETVDKMIDKEGYFALNKQTGTLTVHTSPKKIANIESYLATLREKYRRQVLIEAKIIEVSLSQKHELGIDWRTVGGLISRAAINSTDAVVNITPSVSQDTSFFTTSITSKYSNITGVFKALEQYGKLSVLSNPRLKAMNGQSAVISVGQSVSYLKSLKETHTGTGAERTTEISTEIGSVFDGVLLGVTPIIEDGGVVALHVVPIKSDLVSLDTADFGTESEPYQLTMPRVNLRELSTVSRVKSGDVVLLGGLIMELNNKDRNGLPLFPDSSLFGWLFGVDSKEKKKVELVVAMQVHIIGPENQL